MWREELLNEVLWVVGKNGLELGGAWGKDEEVGIGNWANGVW